MIRRARLADLDALVELEQLFPSDRMSRRSLRRALRSSSILLWVALHGEMVSGSLVLFTRHGSARARIYSVGVHPRARGQGYARRLIAASQRAARDRGCREVSLEVRQDNTAARRLYASLGYTEQQSLPGYYEDGAAGIRLIKPL